VCLCEGLKQRNNIMRPYVLAAVSTALFAVPTAAFSEKISVGPGGIKVGPRYHHYYNYAGDRCGHEACLHNRDTRRPVPVSVLPSKRSMNEAP
jgi:hypothetical protein